MHIKLLLLGVSMYSCSIFSMKKNDYVLSPVQSDSTETTSENGYESDRDEEVFLTVRSSSCVPCESPDFRINFMNKYKNNPLEFNSRESATWINQNFSDLRGYSILYIDKMFKKENEAVWRWFANHKKPLVGHLKNYDSSVQSEVAGDRAHGTSHCLSDLNVAVSTSNPKLLVNVLRYYYKDNAIADHQEYYITPEKLSLIIKGLHDDKFGERSIIYTFFKQQQYDEELKKEKELLNSAVEHHNDQIKDVISGYIPDYKKTYYALANMKVALQKYNE